ncbi:MAG: hypothetical protein LBR81_00290 [Prevotellaceae bacterium]|jgi:hypothetical protein|nr:hypothetical protein [Prevotellaceae bacterium]
MKNKVLLIVWVVALIVQFLAQIYLNFETGILVDGICNIFFLAIPIYIMVIDSHLMQTIYGRILRIIIAIFIVGILFKVQHWPGAAIILSISVSALLITYLVRFITKKEKKLLDWLKVIWLSLYFISDIIATPLNGFNVNLVVNIFFIIMFGYFIYLKIKDKTLFSSKTVRHCGLDPQSPN